MSTWEDYREQCRLAAKGTLYRGKPLESLSRLELIRAINDMEALHRKDARERGLGIITEELQMCADGIRRWRLFA